MHKYFLVLTLGWAWPEALTEREADTCQRHFWFSLQVYTDSTGNCVTIIQGRVRPLLTGLKLVLVYGRSNSTGETNLGKYQSGESMPFSVQGTEVKYFCSPRIRFSVTLCLSYSKLSRQHFFPKNLTNQNILGF